MIHMLVSSDTPSDRLVLFILWLVVFSFSSQVMIITPILPQVAVELHVAESALGTLITAYAVAVVVFALITGPVSDVLGRWRTLFGGTAIMTGALALHGLVQDFTTFLGARLAAGVAGGFSPVLPSRTRATISHRSVAGGRTDG